MTRDIEEGTFIVNYQGEILNYKNEWHQPKIIRTTVVQGGVGMVGGEPRMFQRDGSSRTEPGGDDAVRTVDVDLRTINTSRSTRSQATRLQGH